MSEKSKKENQKLERQWGKKLALRETRKEKIRKGKGKCKMVKVRKG